MVATTRRQLLAGLAGAGGVLALGHPLCAFAPTRVLPEQALRLTRVLVRELGDGAAITVTRGWDIAFARQGRAIVITGSAAEVRVDAPPNLAELARIEAQRSTAAMFPIMLSEDGLITAAGTAETAPADLAAALRAAEGMIAQYPQSAQRRDDLRRYLSEIHRAGAGQLGTLPPDLFFPAGAPQRRAETVTLPDGTTGTFLLLWSSRAAPETGLLIEGEREIRTRVADLERRSRELWTLAPV